MKPEMPISTNAQTWLEEQQQQQIENQKAVLTQQGSSNVLLYQTNQSY